MNDADKDYVEDAEGLLSESAGLIAKAKALGFDTSIMQATQDSATKWVSQQKEGSEQ
jgi:hypothetical protein